MREVGEAERNPRDGRHLGARQEFQHLKRGRNALPQLAAFIERCS